MLSDVAPDLFTYANKIGVIVLLVFILYSGYKGWWIFGSQHKELQDRCTRIEANNERWMRLAIRRGQLEEILRPEEADEEHV